MITARTKTYAHFIYATKAGDTKCLWRDVLGWNDEGEAMIYSYRDHMLVSSRGLHSFAGVEFDNSIDCGHTKDIRGRAAKTMADQVADPYLQPTLLHLSKSRKQNGA